ncbi:MAG TPA: condensation domain-containing protein [Pirellulales bacterium]|nr:condensation domain-containing protein [Pirellulales bacterium]
MQTKLKNVDDIYALTGMQQLMLVHALRDPSSDSLHEQFSLSLDGRIELELLKQAWRRVIERHAPLRTCFLWQGLEKPLQVVRKQVELPWMDIDLRGAGPGGQDGKMEARLQADGDRLLELTRAPLMRMKLVRLAEEEYRFVWRAHHLLFDGWSLAIVLGEVLSIYGALLAGQEPRLPPAPAFRDYLAWLERQDVAAADGFWRRKLAGFTSPTTLDFAAPDPALDDDGPQGASGGRQPPGIAADGDGNEPRPTRDAESGDEAYGEERLRLSVEATAELNGWGRRMQLTPAVLVQGAWALLLARHGGANDVVFGATVSGRPADLPGVEAMVGPFINNLPLRARIDPDRRLADWLQALQSESAELGPYQQLPLTRIEALSAVPPGRRLFESLVVFENYPIGENCRQDAGFKVREVHATAGTMYPLSLVAIPGDELSLALNYQRDRFAVSAVRRLLSELQTLLLTMPAGAERTLGEFSQLGTLSAPSTAVRGVRPRPLGAREFVAPRDELETALTEIWRNLLGLETVGVRDNFFSLGGDSMLAVRLMSEVESECGRKLPLAWLFQDATIEHLAAVLRAPEETTVSSTLVPLRPAAPGMRTPLFCIHPAGGTVFCYRELARHLDPRRPLYGLQARGIDGCQPPHSRIEDMAADYIAEMRGVQPLGPYLLAGWSLGGILAFEMARQLAAEGHEAALLAVIDAGMIAPGESFDEDDFLPVLLEMFPDEHRPSHEDLRGMTAAEQVDFFRRRAERAGVLMGGDNPIQDQHVFQVFQANMNALLEYHPQHYHGRVTLLRAADSVTSLHRLPQLGWAAWADVVDEHLIPGEHVHLFRELQIHGVAAELERCLNQSETGRKTIRGGC